MTRGRKALGLVLLAALTLGVSVPTAAQAVFHSEAEESALSGEGLNTMHFSNGTFDLTCASTSYEGTQSGKTAETITLSASFEGCHIIVLFTFSATVNTTSCKFNLHWNGTTDIECDTPGDTIDITSAGCSIKIGEQTIPSGAEFDLTLFSKALDIEHHYEGIHYTQTGATCGSKTGTNGTLEHRVKLTATNLVGGGQVKYWWTED